MILLRGSNSVVECHPSKVDVASSSLVSRSTLLILLIGGTYGTHYRHYCRHHRNHPPDPLHPYQAHEQRASSSVSQVQPLCQPGNIVLPIPFVELVRINVTENMVDAGLQEIITSDSLNAQVDAQVYFKVRNDEDGTPASEYNVFNYRVQIVALARTPTLSNIIGTMSLKAPSARPDRG